MSLDAQCKPEVSVLNSSPSYGGTEKYAAKNVLEERGNCEWANHDLSKSNFYASPPNMDDAFIVFDMGCMVYLAYIEIQNSNNDNNHEEYVIIIIC